MQHVYPSDLIRGLAELNSTIDCRASRKQQSAWFKQCKCKQCLTQQDSQESRPQYKHCLDQLRCAIVPLLGRSIARSLNHWVMCSRGRAAARSLDPLTATHSTAFGSARDGTHELIGILGIPGPPDRTADRFSIVRSNTRSSVTHSKSKH